MLNRNFCDWLKHTPISRVLLLGLVMMVVLTSTDWFHANYVDTSILQGGVTLQTGDWQKPTSILSYSGQSPTNQAPATIELLASDNLSGLDNIVVEWQFETEDWQVLTSIDAEGSESLQTTLDIADLFTQDGEYAFRAIATDLVSNQQIEATELKIMLDTTVATPTLLQTEPQVVSSENMVLSWSSNTEEVVITSLTVFNQEGITIETIENATSDQLTVADLPNGLTAFTYQVTSCDLVGNCQTSSRSPLVTIDDQAPTITLSGTNQSEVITNGHFDQGLDSWQTYGQVTNNDSSRLTSDGGMAGIAQQISVSAGQLLGFEYSFSESITQAGLVVLLDDQVIGQIKADQQIANAWRNHTTPLTEGEHNLTFSAYGPEGFYVELDTISTTQQVLTSTDAITISGTDEIGPTQLTANYSIAGQPYSISESETLQLQLANTLDDNQIEVQAVDQAGNISSAIYTVLVDTTAPSKVEEFSARLNGNTIDLTWLAPTETGPVSSIAATYQLVYSWQPIADQSNLSVLPIPTIVTDDGQAGGNLRPPLAANQLEAYQIQLPAEKNSGRLYFGLISTDAAGNQSPLTTTSIEIESSETDQIVRFQPGDVLINEVMWMGSTQSAADEWLELYNRTSADINLGGWVIGNAGSSSNPDLVIESGVTIPANGYAVIANYAAADSALLAEPTWYTTGLSLSNDGESLRLFSSTGTEIDQTPTGNWPAGSNTYQKSSMQRRAAAEVSSYLDGLQANNWLVCEFQACADQQNQYWSVSNNLGTPGGVNIVSNPKLLTPHLTTNLEANRLLVKLDNVATYQRATIEVMYQRQYDNNIITEQVTDQINIINDTTQTELYLGTCSDAGQSCVPHQLVDQISVTVTLDDSSDPLTTNLSVEQ